MLRRIGQFFFLVGLLLVGLFFLSNAAQRAQYELLLYALGTFLIYWLTRRRAKRQESGRFRTLRKVMGGGKKEEDQIS